MALMGVDVGGTGVKAVIFSTDGRILASAYREYDMVSEKPGQFELVPNDILAAAKDVIKRAAGMTSEPVDGFGVSSIGESFVCLDENDEVLCNSITYLDTRGMKFVDQLSDYIAPDAFRAITGSVPRVMHSIFRMRILGEEKPWVLKKTVRLHFVTDFIISRLAKEDTGLCDYSLATTTMAFDIEKKEWNRSLLEWAGIDPLVMPKPMPVGTVMGELSESAALELGLRPGIKMVSGGHDHIASSLGAGVYRAGQMMNAIGTVDGFTILANDPECGKRANAYNFGYKPHYFPENYAVMTSNITGGVLLKWFRDHIGRFEKDVWARDGKDFYCEYEKQMAKSPTNLIVLPRFGAQGRSLADRAGILNMTLSTTNEEIYRAFMEGEAYDMRTTLRNYIDNCGRVDSLTAVGGGARCDAYMQIRADVFDLPITTVACDQPGALGDAIMAGIASGVFDSAESAIKSIVGVRRIFEPNAKTHEYYMEMYAKYMKISGFLSEMAE